MLQIQASPIYHRVVDRNPVITDEVPFIPYMWLNSVSGELFTCTDNTIGKSWWKGNYGTIVTPYYQSIMATFTAADYTDLDTVYTPEIGSIDPFDFDNGYKYLDPIYDAYVYGNRLIFLKTSGTGFYFNNLHFREAPATDKFDLQFTLGSLKWGNPYYTLYGASFMVYGSEGGDSAKFRLRGESEVILSLDKFYSYNYIVYPYRFTYDGEYYRFYMAGILQQEFYRPGRVHNSSSVGIRMGGEQPSPTADNNSKLDNVSLWVGGLRP